MEGSSCSKTGAELFLHKEESACDLITKNNVFCCELNNHEASLLIILHKYEKIFASILRRTRQCFRKHFHYMKNIFNDKKFNKIIIVLRTNPPNFN